MESHPPSTVAMTREVAVPADSIWFQGHFPGDPLLPGIAQLHLVNETLRAALGDDMRLLGLQRVRFKRIIRPDETITIRVEPVEGKSGLYRFQLSVDGENACSGLMRTGPPDDKNP